MTRTQELIDWAATAAWDDFPAETREFTTGLLLKTVASMVIGAKEPFGTVVLEHGRRNAGVAHASVVGGGYKTSLESAALVNGTLSHQTESEDCWFTRDTRESASTAWIFPAIVSAAEVHGASGRDVVTACIVAFDLASRMLDASPTLGSVRGINTASWFGCPAAAAGVARIMGLDAAQLGNAMSIALSQAAGLGHQTGTDAHKLEAGHACRAGVLSAELAALGGTGQPDFCDTGLAFAPIKPDGVLRLDRLTAHLGEPPFYVDLVEYKKYPACGMLHASVDAFAALVRERGLGGESVEHITVEVDPIAAEYCDRPLPATINAARFSYSFALASVLLDGRVGYDTYTEAALVEPSRRALQSKVTVIGDEANPPKDNGARLAIALADGDVVRLEVDTFLGHPNSPIPVPTMVDLLRTDLAPYGELGGVIDAVMAMGSAASLGPLFDQLRDVHGVTHTIARFNAGTPADSDRARLWADTLDLCSALDAGGIDELTFSEHHETPSRSCTSPLLAAAGALARTDRCRVSASAVLAALHDPVRLAEDIAFLDVAHPGRLRVVAGLGYRPVEYERFGRAFADRGTLLDDALETVLETWAAGPVRPATPVPELLAVGGQSVPAARRAARLGLPFAPRAHLPELVARYEELGGTSVWMPAPRFVQVHVASDPDAVWADVGRWYLEDAQEYARWQVAGPTSPVFAAASTADELRASGAVAVLTPEECVALAAPDVTLCLHPLAGGMPTDAARASVDLFVQRVLPNLPGGTPRA